MKITSWNKLFSSKMGNNFTRFSALAIRENYYFSLYQKSSYLVNYFFSTAIFLLFTGVLLSTELQAQQTEQIKTQIQKDSLPSKQTVIETIETQTIDPKKTKWLFLHGYEAKYAVQSDGDTLGYATRKLSLKDDHWVLATFAKLNKYFINLKNTETTEFHLKDDLLINDRFYSKTKMTFKKARTMEQQFDWQNKIETGRRGKKNWQIPLEKQVFDRVSHIVQLRADLLAGKQSFSYDVSYKGKLHLYSYFEEKKEVIKTKMGDFSTIKLVRNKSNDDIFTLWLCPELNYLPVQIAQYEQDKADVTLLLESIKYESN